MQTTTNLLVLALFLVGTEAYSIPWPKWGRCPTVEVEQNFDLESYMGTWYSLKTYNVEATQGKGRCVSAQYNIDADTGLVDVYNKQIALRTGKWQSINGTAAPLDASADEGKFVVKFHIKVIGDIGFTVTGPYWVLGTDYTSYSVVYGCSNFLFLHFDTIWVLGRDQVLEGDARKEFNANTKAVLTKNKLGSTKLKIVDQTNCEILY